MRVSNWSNLPTEIRIKIIDALTRISEGEDVSIIQYYIEEEEEYSKVFEQLRMRIFVDGLFREELVDLLDEKDHQEIWDKLQA